MKRLTALGMLLSRPLAVTERALRVMINIASRDEYFSGDRREALEARQGLPLRNEGTATRRNGVAIIPVSGPLVRHADIFDEISGATSYESIRRDLQVALEDPAVKSIVFSIHSPGGEVTSCGELSAAIYEARGQKPIVAYVDGLACSAAYWIASACDRIVTAPTGELGSIGCMLAWLDDRAALEAAGVKEIRFVSSQSPHKNLDPASDVGQQKYQQLVDDLAAVFVADVARNRGVDEATVLESYGKGGVLVGAHAVEAGLADELGNFEALLAELASQGEQTMSKQYATALGLSAEATEEQIIARASSLAKFERETVETLGATDAHDAKGRLAASVEASRELGVARAAAAVAEKKQRQLALRATLERGIAEGVLDPGRIKAKVPGVVPVSVAAELTKAFAAATDAALAEGKSPTTKQLIDAACSVEVSDNDLRAIGGYVDGCGPCAASPVDEPTPDTDKKPIKKGAIDTAGMDPARAARHAKYGHMKSVNDIHNRKE